jgi:nickel-type superoxide dismutase maturation protease
MGGLRESNSKEIFLWLIRRRQRYRVNGASMQPLLCADDEVLVDRQAYRLQSPQLGDIVILRHPTQAGLEIIKRVIEVHEDGRYRLLGDNPDPAQNSSYLVSPTLILGRVTSRFGAKRGAD